MPFSICREESIGREKGITVVVGFDGAAPQDKEFVRMTSESEFLIFPSRRNPPGEGADGVGRGARFTVKILNSSNQPQQVLLRINHEDKQGRTTPFRDVCYTQHDDGAWRMRPCPVTDGESHLQIEFAPGTTIVAQSPTYNVSQCDQFVTRIGKHPYVESGIYGKSEGNLPLHFFRVRDPAYRAFPKRKVGIFARNHAYETSGNYCVEGMVDFLLTEEDEIAQYFLSQYDFCFAPMTNPDGVKQGLVRCTKPSGGADLNREVTNHDRAHSALMKLSEREQFDVFINLHNWQNKTRDGILCNEEGFGALIHGFMPSPAARHKIREVKSKRHWLAEQGFEDHVQATEKLGKTWRSWKNLVGDMKAGVNPVTFEFPWYGRCPNSMRELGREALLATIHADIHYNLETAKI